MSDGIDEKLKPLISELLKVGLKPRYSCVGSVGHNYNTRVDSEGREFVKPAYIRFEWAGGNSWKDKNYVSTDMSGFTIYWEWKEEGMA